MSISSTQPLGKSTDKFFLLKDDISIIATISAGENDVWALGDGYIHVGCLMGISISGGSSDGTLMEFQSNYIFANDAGRDSYFTINQLK